MQTKLCPAYYFIVHKCTVCSAHHCTECKQRGSGGGSSLSRSSNPALADPHLLTMGFIITILLNKISFLLDGWGVGTPLLCLNRYKEEDAICTIFLNYS